MRISLIYVQTIEGNNVNPPLGLMYLAAVAIKAGHQVQLIDVDPTEINITEKVRKFNPLYIGLSFLTTEYDKARNLSHTLRNEIRSAFICCGGVHTSLDTENVLREFDVDFCVIGEGERTFLEVCKRIDTGQSYDDVKGVWLLKDGLLIKNPLRELIEDLDTIPLPARDIVDFSNIYLTFPGCIRGRYTRSTAVIAGRGCNFNCSFCAAQKLHGRKYRLRSPDNVIDEIVYLQKTFDIIGILFHDSTLTTDRKWVTSLCEMIIKKGVKFVWSCNARVNTVDLEMLKLMKKAGCIQMEYGIESGSPKILNILNKKITPEEAISTFRMTESVGIRAGASFMIGNPDEEISDLELTFDLAKKLNASYTIFFFTIPYPGTELWEIAQKRHLIPNSVSFGTEWNARAAESPVMNTNIQAEQLKYLRARYQNHFLGRNYLHLKNLVVVICLLWVILRNPFITWRRIRRVLTHRRWDSLIEEVLIIYRKNLYKYY